LEGDSLSFCLLCWRVKVYDRFSHPGDSIFRLAQFLSSQKYSSDII
jgi:hypothetical protein